MSGGDRQHAKPPAQAKKKPAAKGGRAAQADSGPVQSFPLADNMRAFHPGPQYWLTHDPDLGHMEPDQLLDEARQIGEWKHRQIASYADTDANRLEQVRMALIAQAELFNGEPPKRQQHPLSGAGTQPGPAPSNVARPQALDPKSSMDARATTVRDYNEVAKYLRQPNIPEEDRRKLQPMFADLQRKMAGELNMRAQERYNALLNESLGFQPGVPLAERARRVDAIKSFGSRGGMNSFQYGRERVFIGDEGLGAVRKQVLQEAGGRAEDTEGDSKDLWREYEDFTDRTYDHKFPYPGFFTMKLAGDDPLKWENTIHGNLRFANQAISRTRELKAAAQDPWNTGPKPLLPIAEQLELAEAKAGAARGYYEYHYGKMMHAAGQILTGLEFAKHAGQIAANVALPAWGSALYASGESLLVQNREIAVGQRTGYDLRSVAREGVSSYVAGKVTGDLTKFLRPASRLGRVATALATDRIGSAVGTATNLELRNLMGGGQPHLSATEILEASGEDLTDVRAAVESAVVGKLAHHVAAQRKGKSGIAETLAEDEPKKKKEQASLTVLAQRPQQEGTSHEAMRPEQTPLPQEALAAGEARVPGPAAGGEAAAHGEAVPHKTPAPQKPNSAGEPATADERLVADEGPLAEGESFVPPKPDVVIKDPRKAKGVLGEVTKAFVSHPGNDWDHVGGGSETASSRIDLSRRSSYDQRHGQEGTAGHDDIVVHVPTGKPIVGEQKATASSTFTKATAITTYLEKNLKHSAKRIKARADELRKTDNESAQRLYKTARTLLEARKAMVKARNGDKNAKLPDVAFELTNVLGEGKQVGKEFIDRLAKEYGDNPAFLDHLLDHMQVRDPELAKAKRRDQEGTGGTSSDKDIVPVKDVLTPAAATRLESLRTGKTTKQIRAQQAAEQRAAKKAAEAPRKKIERDARTEAKRVGAKVRKQRLAEIKEEFKNSGKSRPKSEAAKKKLSDRQKTMAKKAGEKARGAKYDELMAPHLEQDRKTAAENKAKKKADQAAAKLRTAQEKQALANSKQMAEAIGRMSDEQFSNMPIEEYMTLVRQAHKDGVLAEALQKKVRKGVRTPDLPDPKKPRDPDGNRPHESAPGNATTAEPAAAGTTASEPPSTNPKASEPGKPNTKTSDPASANTKSSDPASTNTKTSDSAPANTKASDPTPANTPNPEPAPSTPGPVDNAPTTKTSDASQNQNHGQRPQSRVNKALHAGTHLAGGIRGVDAFQDALDRGDHPAVAVLEGLSTYAENVNPIAGAIGNLEGKLSKERTADGKTQQYYGEDTVDAVLGTVGEAGAAYIYPGETWDQVVNTGVNLLDAADDHLKRTLTPGSPEREKANLRTVADVAADVTPSRLVSETTGAALRAYYDIGKAIGGKTSGVEKFADDAINEKLGTVFAPPAMAFDFLGNLADNDASHALDKTLKKARNTKLVKLGNASGDALYDFGQSESAKRGDYGIATQSASELVGIASDLIRGDSLQRAMERAAEAGKGSLADKIGNKLGDVTFDAVEAAKDAPQRFRNWWKKL